MRSILFFTYLLFPLKKASMTIEASDLHSGLKLGAFDLIVDVRSLVEWEEGHIEGATLMVDLASTKNVSSLRGCEKCRIALYCRSGARAASAITFLESLGFTSLFNGLGVMQWTSAGYPLSNAKSVVPDCGVDSSKCMVPSMSSSCRTLQKVHHAKSCCVSS